MSEPDLVIYQISRSRIEAGDWHPLAEQFDAERLSEKQLRNLFGRAVWTLDGFDSDPAELYEIPAVRRFLAAWHRHRPHWLFFGSLDTDSLKVMYVCLLEKAVAVRDDPTGMCQVAYDPHELGPIVAADLELADTILERIGISPAKRLERMRAVTGYFGLNDGGTQ